MGHSRGVIQIKYTSKPNSLISGTDTATILNLGDHGFADSFFSEKDYNKAGESVPLICQLDKVTGLIQLLNFTEPSERYGNVDYSYTSSNSKTSREHWTEFAQYLFPQINFGESNILEIGSNDGFLLEVIQNRGHRVLGVDASDFMSNFAKAKGINTLTGIFGESEELLLEIIEFSNIYKIIIANNVLNHSNDPINFVRHVKKLLSSDGIFVFEVPYWFQTIKSLHFDQIYHEHVTYFTVKSAKELLKVVGLEIINVEVVNYHGGSLRITAAHASGSESTLVENMIEMETKDGLFSVLRYEKYFDDISKVKNKFMREVEKNKKSGKTLFGVGAAAKANTLLTFYNLNHTYLDFILDASKFKQGKITPVTKIQIYGDSHVSNLKNAVGVVLAWNIGDEVKKNILNINSRVEFMSL
jgi:2-polyprenyl-3-methyl-5-hydroxy-6-metoxy-1,4-benzoquinol methylase